MTHVLYLALDDLSLEGNHEKAIICAVQKCGNDALTILVNCPNLYTETIDALWSRLQTLLGSIYVVQLKESCPENPLFDCNVVFEPYCGYDVACEPEIQSIIAPRATADAWNQRRASLSLSPLSVTTIDDPSTAALTIPQATVHSGKFDRVIIGGTFDHLHAGHKILLTMSALLTRTTFAIGVTDDSKLHTKKYHTLIAPVDERINYVRQYLFRARRNIDYELVPIFDPFGPTITDPSFKALVCSKETLKGGELVCEERAKRKFPPLELWVIDVISSDNVSIDDDKMHDLKLSSTAIRRYLANKQGAPVIQ